MGRLFDFVLGGSLWGNVAAGTAGLAVLVFAWQVDKALYGRAERAAGKRVGVEEQKQKTGKANDQVIKRSDVVRARSRDKRVRGTVDPNYID